MNMNKYDMEIIDVDTLKKICADYFVKVADQDFFFRVWSQNQDKYFNRLKQLDFHNKEKVLDAGSGFGQWSFNLGKMNKAVTGIEYDKERVNACNALQSFFKADNVRFIQGNIEQMPFEDSCFDAVFCFGVIMCTNYKKTFKEIYRILKPNGLFFFNASDLGWFIFNIIENYNSSVDFSTRQWAIDSLKHSIDFYATGAYHKKGLENLVMPKDYVINLLNEIGFKVYASGKQGTCSISGVPKWEVDRPEKRYGVNDTYEVICYK